jgi:hypothetical protein
MLRFQELPASRAWDWATLGTWKQQLQFRESWDTWPQCLGGRQCERWLGRKRIWRGPMEKFKQPGAQTVKGLVISGPTLPGENKFQCLRITGKTEHWAHSWWSALIPRSACWQWSFAARYGLRLSYLGNWKPKNSHTSGSLWITNHSVGVVNNYKRDL